MTDEWRPAEVDDIVAPPSDSAGEETASAEVETPTSELAALSVEPARPRSLIGRLFRRRTALEMVENRLRELNEAVALYPNSPANYVLRGELYLDAGEAVLAEADFRQALTLAQADYEASRWGLVAQALQDRARAGLTKAIRRQESD